MEGAGQRSMKAAAYRRSGISERLQSILRRIYESMRN
jgi:hypothetical protein